VNSVRLFQLPKVYLPGTSGGLVLTILLACVLGASPIARADSMTSDLDSVSFDLTELATCFSSTPGGPPCTLAIALRAIHSEM
jgi:hypothetical protein